MMKNPNGSWQAPPYFWETPTDKIGSGFVAKEFFFLHISCIHLYDAFKQS